MTLPFTSFPVWPRPRIAFCCELGLFLAAFLFFPLLVIAPRGVAALECVSGAIALILVATRPGAVAAPLRRAALLLGALLAWSVLSSPWSIGPARSLEVALRLAGLFAAGLSLAAAADRLEYRRPMLAATFCGLALGLAMAGIEVVTHGKLSAPFFERGFRETRLNQASIAFAILLPMTVRLMISPRILWLGVALGILMAAATGAIVTVLDGTTAKAALAIGIAAGIAIYLRPGLARVAAGLTLLAVLTAPLTFGQLDRVPLLMQRADSIKISVGHRMMIWSFTADRIAERPLTGWGLDASRAIPGGGEIIRYAQAQLPLHPHNDPLQLWLELGLPGALIFGLFLMLPWQALGRDGQLRLYRAGCAASLAVGLVACFGTYGIWQEWWQGTLWLSLFLVRASRPEGAPPV